MSSEVGLIQQTAMDDLVSATQARRIFSTPRYQIVSFAEGNWRLSQYQQHPSIGGSRPG
jgi:hypothetical protein